MSVSNWLSITGSLSIRTNSVLWGRTGCCGSGGLQWYGLIRVYSMIDYMRVCTVIINERVYWYLIILLKRNTNLIAEWFVISFKYTRLNDSHVCLTLCRPEAGLLIFKLEDLFSSYSHYYFADFYPTICCFALSNFNLRFLRLIFSKMYFSLALLSFRKTLNLKTLPIA